jgi:4-hydroxy-tetrahydrodipicolinate reductase
MGRAVVAEVLASGGVSLVGAVDREDSPAQGLDAGMVAGALPCGVRVSADALALFADADAVLDFTAPAATAAHAMLAAQGKTVLIVGTTGLDGDEAAGVHRAARHTPIVWAPNFAMGITLLGALVEDAARALGVDFDVEVVEFHHRHKKEAPSGTALGLGRAAAAGRGRAFEEARLAADRTGERASGGIGFAVLRGGDVVGDHSVVFAGPGERLELTHRAASREIYARGAVRAARWAYGKPPGLYTMRDVLGLARPIA